MLNREGQCEKEVCRDFLAPQVTGYFVLNDDFRYVVESESLEDNSMSISGIIYNTPVVPLPSDPGLFNSAP